MLHFLWKAEEEEAPVTVVIDELTPEVQKLLDDLQATFREAAYFVPGPAEAA
ncbi:MAG: hypothetical protein L0241_02980 [Planctomycetia bacterium]|nr:hypothetical protein [Planctomycetia bacterium]